MTSAVLSLIDQKMAEIGINYEFGVWTSELVYPYFVGTYTESSSTTEDGKQETAFLLDGFTTGTWLDLENAKAKIENCFSNYTAILENHSGVAVLYENALPVPTGDANLKRIQINLTIKEWSVKDG